MCSFCINRIKLQLPKLSIKVYYTFPFSFYVTEMCADLTHFENFLSQCFLEENCLHPEYCSPMGSLPSDYRISHICSQTRQL